MWQLVLCWLTCARRGVASSRMTRPSRGTMARARARDDWKWNCAASTSPLACVNFHSQLGLRNAGAILQPTVVPWRDIYGSGKETSSDILWKVNDIIFLVGSHQVNLWNHFLPLYVEFIPLNVEKRKSLNLFFFFKSNFSFQAIIEPSSYNFLKMIEQCGT